MKTSMIFVLLLLLEMAVSPLTAATIPQERQDIDAPNRAQIRLEGIALQPGQTEVLGTITDGELTISGLKFRASGDALISDDWFISIGGRKAKVGDKFTIGPAHSQNGPFLYYISKEPLIFDLTIGEAPDKIVYKLGVAPLAIAAPAKQARLISTDNKKIVVNLARADLRLTLAQARGHGAAIRRENRAIIEKLMWTMDDIGTIKATWPTGAGQEDKADGKAKTTTNKATYSGMPNSSLDFEGAVNNGGARDGLSIELSNPDDPRLTPARLKWWAFFAPEAIEVDANLPNWYFYWCKEHADQICIFSKTVGDLNYVVPVTSFTGIPNNDPTMGVYYHTTDLLEVKFSKMRTLSLVFPKAGAAIPASLKVRTASYRVTAITDVVNVVVAHEVTHRKCWRATKGAGALADVDSDGVPDLWEADLGLDSNTTRSINLAAFDGSGGGDQEFVAWIGPAMNSAFGKVSWAGAPIPYIGITPAKSDPNRDWSWGGFNYNKYSAEMKVK